MSIRTVEQPAPAVHIAPRLTLAEVLRVCDGLQICRLGNGGTIVNGVVCATPEEATARVVNHYTNTVATLRERARKLHTEADRIDALPVGVIDAPEKP